MRLILSVILLIVVGCTKGPTLSHARQESLKETFQREHPVPVRVLNDIGVGIQSPECQTLLFDLLFTEVDWFNEPKIFHMASQMDVRDAGTKLLQAYNRSDKSDDNYRKYVWALMSMHGSNHKKYACLKKSISDAKTQEQLMWFSIASDWLNNSGKDSLCLLEQKDTSSKQSNELLRMLAETGCKVKANPQNIETFAFWLKNESDNSIYASVILTGTSDKSVIEMMKMAEKQVYAQEQEADVPTALFYSLCLARLSQEETKERMVSICREIGAGGFYGDLIAIRSFSDVIFDNNMASIIQEGLSSQDNDIIKGALAFCWILGYRCQTSHATILDILKNNEDEKTRKMAAMALSMISPPEDIDVLIEISQSDQSDEVRQSVKDAIKVISLGTIN